MTASVTSLACAGLSQRLVTRTSAKLVMVLGMALIGAGILWAAQAPPGGHFWPDLAGPFFIAGIGTAFAFIPISIGALAGVTERDAGVASGLLNTSQNLGGDRSRRRLVHRGLALPYAGPPRLRNRHRPRRRVPAGPVGVRPDRPRRYPRRFVLIRRARKADVIATAQS
jgi:hypothetical protein